MSKQFEINQRLFNLIVTLVNDASNYNKSLDDQLAELRPLINESVKQPKKPDYASIVTVHDERDPKKPDKNAIRTILPSKGRR